MVNNRNMLNAILQVRTISKNKLLEPIELWSDIDKLKISINKVKNTTVVNGVLVYLITYKAVTKYRKNIEKSTMRIYIPSTEEIYLIEDTSGFDGLFNTLNLKRIE